MFKWFVALLTALFAFGTTTDADYVGRVAAEAAYAAMLSSSTTPAKPKVPTKDCKTCNGTGRIRSGDDVEWIKCPDCDPTLSPTPEDGSDEPTVKTPKSDPGRYSPPPAATRLVR